MKCICGIGRKLPVKSEYSNLISHLNTAHPGSRQRKPQSKFGLGIFAGPNGWLCQSLIEISCKAVLETTRRPSYKNSIVNEKIIYRLATRSFAEKTHFPPVLRCTTRWSGEFNLLTRLFELTPFLNPVDPDLVDFIHSPKEIYRQKNYCNSWKILTLLPWNDKKMLSLASCQVFIWRSHQFVPGNDNIFIWRCPIIENPSFEKSIVLCLEGHFDKRSDLQKADLDRLQKTPEVEEDVESSSFADKLLSFKNAKIEVYGNIKWVPLTSNKCERPFSTAKLIAAPQGNQMTTLHLEENCFLLLNRKYWNSETVQVTI